MKRKLLITEIVTFHKRFYKNTIKIHQLENGRVMKLKMISQTDLGYLRLLIDLITLIDENKAENQDTPETSKL